MEQLTLDEWNLMPLEEKRTAAHRLGKRVADLETELQMKQALLSSSNAVLEGSNEPPLAGPPGPGESRSREEGSSNPTAEGPAIGGTTNLNAEQDDEDFVEITRYAPTEFYPDAFAGVLKARGCLRTHKDLSASSSTSSSGGGAGVHSETAGVHSDGPETIRSEETDEKISLILEYLTPDLLAYMMKCLDSDSLARCFMVQRAFLLGGLSRSCREAASAEAVAGTSMGHLSALEPLFRDLCESVYLQQSKRKTVDPKNWGGWREMWLRRPRVRTNGFYCMANEWVKPATHDLWGGVTSGVKILKVQTFRYFRFLPNGTVLYSLTHQPPEHMTRVLARYSASNPIRSRDLQSQAADVIKGTYSLKRNTVFVKIRSHYNTVHFQLELAHGHRGHFSRLEVLHHFSRGLRATPESRATHHYESQGYSFRFLRVYPNLS